MKSYFNKNRESALNNDSTLSFSSLGFIYSFPYPSDFHLEEIDHCVGTKMHKLDLSCENYKLGIHIVIYTARDWVQDAVFKNHICTTTRCSPSSFSLLIRFGMGHTYHCNILR